MNTTHQAKRKLDAEPSPQVASPPGGCWFACAQLSFRMLIADLDTERVRTISEALQRVGMECDALAKNELFTIPQRAADYDVLILAHDLARSNGHDLLGQLRIAERNAAAAGDGRGPVPVILVGTSGTATRVPGVPSDQIIRALGTPLDPVELLCTLCVVLGPRRHGARDAGPTQPPVDLDQLDKRCMGNKQLAARLMATFLEGLPALLNALMEAIDNDDADAAAKTAHRLKGGAFNLAIVEVGGRARQIEDLASAGRLDRAAAEAAALRDEIERLRVFIEAHFQGNLIETADRR